MRKGEAVAVMVGRSADCAAVLKRYGLEQSSMAVIGADRLPEFPDWRVMVTGGVKPEYLDVPAARKLANELARIGEMMLSQRLSAAADTAQRQMRPKE